MRNEGTASQLGVRTFRAAPDNTAVVAALTQKQKKPAESGLNLSGRELL